MESRHIISTDLEEDIVIFFLFYKCDLGRDIRDDRSWDSVILDTSRTDIFREHAGYTLFRCIRAHSYSSAVSEDEKWDAIRTSREGVWDRTGNDTFW